MAVVITAKVNAVNNNLGANGTLTATGLTTSGASLILIKSAIGNNTASSVASATVNGNTAFLAKKQVSSDTTSNAEVWWFWSTGALASVSVVVNYTNTAGAGALILVEEATGTDSSSIGNVGGANGTSGTTAGAAVCSANNSVMTSSSLDFGSTNTAGANTAIISSLNDAAGDFLTSARNTQSTASGTTYTITTTHTSNQWAIAVAEIKPAAVTLVAYPQVESALRRPDPRLLPPNFSEAIPVQPGPAFSPPGETSYPPSFFRQPPPRPPQDNPPPLRSPVVPVLTKISEDVRPPYRQQPPRPLTDNPPPLRSPVVPVLTKISEDIRAFARPSRAPYPPDPLVLPLRIIPPPGEDLRALRRPQPIWMPPAPETFPAPVVNNVFPLAAHASGHYYVDKNGVPYDINCWTIWAAMMGSTAEQDLLITAMLAHNVNAVEFGWIWRDGAARSTRAPFANDGAILPFTTKIGGGAWTGSTVDPDYATPNAAYDAFAVSFIDRLAAAGILAFVFPSYVGTSGGGGSAPDDGWANEMVRQSTATMQAYGAHVANLLKNRTNVFWGLGGDAGTVNRPFTGTERDAVTAMVTGIQSVSGQLSGPQFFAEWATNSIAQDQTDFVNGVSGPTLGDTCTVQSLYNFFGEFITNAARGYASTPTKPTWVQEGPFEKENAVNGTGFNPGATEPVRRWYAWAWLSGAIAGNNLGDGFLWPFNKTGSLPLANWQTWVSPPGTNTQGLVDIRNMRTLRRTYSWWKLAPTPSIITGNAGSGNGSNTSGPAGGNTTTVVAATASDGSVIIIYYPPDQTGSITVDTSGLSGLYRKRYYDVTNNTYTAIGGGGFTNTPGAGTVFAAPPTTSTGEADGFIILDTQTAPSVEVTVNDAPRRAQTNQPKMPWAFEALPAAQAAAVVPRDPQVAPVLARPSRTLPEAPQAPLPPLVFKPTGEAAPAAVRSGALFAPRYELVLPPILFPTWTLDYPATARAARSLPLLVEPPPPILVPTWTQDYPAAARPSRSLPVSSDALPLKTTAVSAWAQDYPAASRASRALPATAEPPPPIFLGWLPPSADPLARASRSLSPSPEPPPPQVFGWPSPPNPPLARASRVSLPEGSLSNPGPVVPNFPWSAPPNDPIVRAAWRLPFDPGAPPPPLTFGWPSPPNAAIFRADRQPGVPAQVPPPLFFGWPPPPSDPTARGGRARLHPDVPPAPPGLALVALLPWAQDHPPRLQVPPPLRLPRPWDVFPALAAAPLVPWGQEGSAAPWRASRAHPELEVANPQVGLPADALFDLLVPAPVQLMPRRPSPAAEVAPPLLDRGSFWVLSAVAAPVRRPTPYFSGELPVVFIPPPLAPWGYVDYAPQWRPRPAARFPPELVVALAPLLVQQLPKFPLPPPFAVQLVDEGGPVDLTGKTVVCRTQPADRTRAVRAGFAEVVDALRGLVQHTWVEQDLRGVPTGDMLLQFVVFDDAGRPRTYPGQGHYYHQEITGRTR